MLICKLEMTTLRGSDETYPVGEIRIGQIGGDCFVADYLVEIDKASRYARTPGVWRSGNVRRFDHSHLGPYDLLLRALVACLGGRSWTAIAAIRPSACIFTDQLEPA
jgi:hypothetical protein